MSVPQYVVDMDTDLSWDQVADMFGKQAEVVKRRRAGSPRLWRLLWQNGDYGIAQPRVQGEVGDRYL